MGAFDNPKFQEVKDSAKQHADKSPEERLQNLIVHTQAYLLKMEPAYKKLVALGRKKDPFALNYEQTERVFGKLGVALLPSGESIDPDIDIMKSPSLAIKELANKLWVRSVIPEDRVITSYFFDPKTKITTIYFNNPEKGNTSIRAKDDGTINIRQYDGKKMTELPPFPDVSLKFGED